MSDAANRIVRKLWSYCQVLRDDGLSYQDYLEQLTFLLFLKMSDERARLTGEPQPITLFHGLQQPIFICDYSLYFIGHHLVMCVQQHSLQRRHFSFVRRRP